MLNDRWVTVIKICAALSIILIGVNLFTRIFSAREKRSPESAMPAPSQESADINAVPGFTRQMQSNAIPTADEVEGNINKAEIRKVDAESARAEFERKKEEILRIEEEPDKQITGTEKKSTSGGQYPPERKKVIFPTREERNRMQSQGIICY